MPEFSYDLLVIGSGPAGQRAAIQAAKLNKRVAMVERKAAVGGVCINTGTIPSKTLREAVLYLSGYRMRGLYGASYAVKQNITMEDLLFRTDHVVRHEIDVTRHQLLRNRVEVFTASATFVDPHTLRLVDVEDRGPHGSRDVRADRVVIATGTEVTRDPSVTFDGQRIFSSDDILQLKSLPRSLTVVGAGVIGCEFACIFATLGVRVTLVDKRERLLPFV
ncbi:MAG TPA: FAD-dependent oxidoreductase, partial [Chloroflexota bacterium]